MDNESRTSLGSLVQYLPIISMRNFPPISNLNPSELFRGGWKSREAAKAPISAKPRQN